MRSREDIVLAEAADLTATVAWAATNDGDKDHRNAAKKALKAMADAYVAMKIAKRRNDRNGFYAASAEFDEVGASWRI